MSKQISFSKESIDAVQSVRMDTYERVEQLEQAIKSVKRFRKVIVELEKYVDKHWPFHVLYLMSKNAEFIKEQCEAGPFSLQELENLRAEAQVQAKKLRTWYPNFLEQACEDEGLPLDMTSRFPVYTFEKGFFELIIDSEGTATFSNSERKLGVFPADIGAVVEKVRDEHKRIFSKPYDGRYFLKKLREHYLGVLQRQKQEDGTDVPIRRIAGRMASEKGGYQTDQFIVDLSRLAREGPLEIDRRRLELLHTRDDVAGMLLHDAGSVAYVGFVRFQEVGS